MKIQLTIKLRRKKGNFFPAKLRIITWEAESQKALRTTPSFRSRSHRHTHFLKKIYFNRRLITLQYCGGFCHTLTWLSHGCTYVPPIQNIPQLHPYTILLGCPRAPALSALLHASNLHWSSILHMVIYNFNAILSNRHTLTFPHRVQKFIIYICVSFAVLHIYSSLSSF